MKAKLFMVACMLLCVAGCTSEERIAAYKGVLQQAKELSAKADDYITAGEAAIKDIELALADPNVPFEDALKLREKLASLTVAIEKAKVEKARVDKIITSTLAKIDALENYDFWGELEVFGQTAMEISPQIPAPVGPIVWIVGVAAAALGTNMKQKKKLAGVVRSVDAVIAAANTDVAGEEIKRILKANQSPKVREAVRRIKAA